MSSAKFSWQRDVGSVEVGVRDGYADGVSQFHVRRRPERDFVGPRAMGCSPTPKGCLSHWHSTCASAPSVSGVGTAAPVGPTKWFSCTSHIWTRTPSVARSASGTTPRSAAEPQRQLFAQGTVDRLGLPARRPPIRGRRLLTAGREERHLPNPLPFGDVFGATDVAGPALRQVLGHGRLRRSQASRPLLYLLSVYVRPAGRRRGGRWHDRRRRTRLGSIHTGNRRSRRSRRASASNSCCRSRFRVGSRTASPTTPNSLAVEVGGARPRWPPWPFDQRSRASSEPSPWSSGSGGSRSECSAT
jgi:hypothetical protein